MSIATSDVIRTGNLSVRFLLKVVEKSWYRIRGALLERLAEPDEALTRCHFRYMRYLAEKLSTRGAWTFMATYRQIADDVKCRTAKAVKTC